VQIFSGGKHVLGSELVPINCSAFCSRFAVYMDSVPLSCLMLLQG
jgi:hypothetical protein